MTRPIILGLTGSIGMGKTTVANMFAKRGVPVFDADAEVRRMQGPGGKLVDAIEAAFPGSTGPDGVDRTKLGNAVFSDQEQLERLEAIVHPAVRNLREVFLLEHAGAQLVVFDIPLLLEKGNKENVDKILVVSAPYEVQRERVLARPGMTPDRFANILAAQMPDVEKRLSADFVIDTGQPLDRTDQAVGVLVEKLCAGDCAGDMASQ